MQSHLEHVYDTLLVDGTATTKKENIGKIFSVADALRPWAELPVDIFCLRVGSNHSHRVTVLNVSRLLTAGKCFSNYRHDSLLRN